MLGEPLLANWFRFRRVRFNKVIYVSIEHYLGSGRVDIRSDIGLRLALLPKAGIVAYKRQVA
jgi:hypothetical protein